ncbi:hypothetical protein M408DRAFT_330709 [Serendipita vermifera MAFF 305830]|uniref:Enoyl reductase (ER) domain-containing protein n=1 Tax=Serendipita vermifera MAFF 305830 TaxID=933852 RepID=A0A0C3ANI8_SERVB|nr:hypothetical protein M408DRAFT_330709 [Serendipita vermifera MAFF 305830]
MSSQIPANYTRIILNERPKKGPITETTFKTEELSTEELKQSMGAGDVLVRVDYVSLDPAMRGWLNDARSYVEPVKVGAIMRAGGIGTVLAVGKDVQKVKVGDSVNAMLGWTEFAVLPEKSVAVLKVPSGAVPLDFLGVLGMTGITAYYGLLEIGQLKAGETLVVSGAAGATGSVACQMGKLLGAKVIAIAGADDKCKWLEEDLGVDKALNYKSPTFKKDFQSAVGYLDVYFDNVGGEILDLCLTRLNKNARIALCGAISAYNSPSPHGLQNYLTLIAQSASIRGFIITDYAPHYDEARAKLGEWLGQGKLKRKFHIQQGIKDAPKHLNELYEGKNTGKMVVKVSPQAEDARL